MANDLPSSPEAAKRLNQQATEIEQLRQRHAASVFPEIGWCQGPMYELCKVNTPQNMALDVQYLYSHRWFIAPCVFIWHWIRLLYTINRN